MPRKQIYLSDWTWAYWSGERANAQLQQDPLLPGGPPDELSGDIRFEWLWGGDTFLQMKTTHHIPVGCVLTQCMNPSQAGLCSKTSSVFQKQRDAAILLYEEPNMHIPGYLGPSSTLNSSYFMFIADYSVHSFGLSWNQTRSYYMRNIGRGPCFNPRWRHYNIPSYNPEGAW